MNKPQSKTFVKLFILAIGFSLTIVKSAFAQSIFSDFGWKLSSGMLHSSEPLSMLIVGFTLLFAASIGRDMFSIQNLKENRKSGRTPAMAEYQTVSKEVVYMNV